MTSYLEERKRLRKIQLKGGNVILAIQPGVGKSFNAREFCNSKEALGLKIAFTSETHTFLSECESKVNGFIQWYGIGQPEMCKRNNIYKLLKLGLTASVICRGCGYKDECKYLDQFTHRDRVGFPTEYLTTFHCKGFDMLFVEESISKVQEYSFDFSNLLQGFIVISNRLWDLIEESEEDDDYVLKTRLDSVREAIDALIANDYPILENKLFYDEGMTRQEKLKNLQTIKNNLLVDAVSKNDDDFIKKSQLADLDNLKGWLKYGKIYGYDRKCYFEPYLFKVFDLQREGVKINILQASFEKNTFNDLVDRYEKENGYRPTFEIYYSNATNKKSRCVQITKSGFSKTKSDSDEGNDFIMSFLNKLNEVYGRENIGLITYKKDCGPDATVKDGEIAYGFEAMHFRNTAGLNRFENRRILVVIGTPTLSLEQKVAKYNELYNTKKTKEEFEKIVKEDTDNGRFPDYTGTLLENIVKSEEEFYMYDCLHRNRGLIYNEKTIFVLGMVPDRIKYEFTFETVEKNNVMDWLSKQPEIREKFIRNEILDLLEKGKTINYIAKQVNLTIEEVMEIITKR